MADRIIESNAHKHGALVDGTIVYLEGRFLMIY